MTKPTPHGQVPEALIDLIDAYAETRHRCGGIYNARTEAARNAVIEALSGVQALSAAPAVDITTAGEMQAFEAWYKQDCVIEGAAAKMAAKAAWKARAMLAASPTPPAEQAAPKAATGEQDDHQILAITTAYEQGVGKGHQAYKSGKEITNPYDSAYGCDLAWQYGYKEGKEQAAPKTAPGVGNSGFDYQTAADFLSGKTVIVEALREFVHASRQAHDEKTALSAMLLSVRGELASREAEIALLKKALLEAEAAPQQEAQEPCPTCAALARTVMLDQVSFDRKPDCYGIRQITDDEGVEEWEDIRTSPDVAREEANDMMATGRGEIYEVVPLWTTPQPAPATQQAPQQEAQEPVAYVHVPHSTVEGKVRPVVSFEKYQQDYADGIYSTRIPLYTAPQPAPAPLSECLRLLNSFEYEGDEDSQAKAFFKAHINEDWFFHVKNSLELALAAQGCKDA